MIFLINVILALVSLSILQINGYSKSVIYVNSQLDFDNLPKSIDKEIKAKNKKVDVVFANGRYYFNDNNQIFINKNNATSLTFRARNAGKAIITSDGELYTSSDVLRQDGHYNIVKLKKSLDKYCTFQTIDGSAIYLGDTGFLNDSLHTNIAHSSIEVVDTVKRIARVRIDKDLAFLRNKSSEYFQNKYICFKAQGFDCIREILYSDGSYLYFSLNDWLLKKKDSYVTNMFSWSKRATGRGYQPYYVINERQKANGNFLFYDNNFVYIPKGQKTLRVCWYDNWLNVENSEANIVIRDLQFNGTRHSKAIDSWGDYKRKDSPLMNLIYSKNITVKNCKFSNIGVMPIIMSNCNSISVYECKFINNYSDNLMNVMGSKKVQFIGNVIDNPSKIITYRMGISINDSENVLVSNNVVRNISRAFIIMGWKNNNICITNNELCLSDIYRKYRVRNLSSDTGAFIYSWGDSPFIASNNVIHDLPSNLNYSGIMVDNGTGHSKIIGNLFYGIGDYCVNAWRNGAVNNSNEGNVLDSNVILGKILFGGFDKTNPNNSSYSSNLFLYNESLKAISKYATDKGNNRTAEGVSVQNERIYINRNDYSTIIKNKQIDKFVKGYLKVN